MTPLGRPFTVDDARALAEGTHSSAYEVLGAHLVDDGVAFRVWAPNARSVSVIGELNDWSPTNEHALDLDPSGVWQGRMKAAVGQQYKYRITPESGVAFDKADPYGFAHEEPPRSASVISDLDYAWADHEWMSDRGTRLAKDAPVSIYEVHLGSWRSTLGGYRALGAELIDHVGAAGFTHVEILPITEHPFYGSWGYQSTGYFAPTSRYGSPVDLMAMIDDLHQAGIGVILDWVPSHFPDDAFGLAVFDGTHLYEHPDPRKGHHPDWDSCVFDYDRPEVRSFLLSSANFWAEKYHIDGIRVDAVASMLYLDYSRAEGQWIPNAHGGNENLGAVSLLKELNRSLTSSHAGIQVIAEESTAWPGVTKSIDDGGLGFAYKWDMGWMFDTLQFLRREPSERRHHHGDLTFRSVYQGSENFILSLSHDEVVHGKGSLLSGMPGDPSRQLANLRLLLAYQWAVPGKKLLFMGGEFGHVEEWDHDTGLAWGLLADPAHRGILDFVTELNALYRSEPALHIEDCGDGGLAWIVGDDVTNSVFAFLRTADAQRPVLVTANFSAAGVDRYRLGVPIGATWTPLLESDETRFGGRGNVNEPVVADDQTSHGHPHSVEIHLAPLSVSFFAPS